MFSGIIEDLGLVKKIGVGDITIETKLTGLKVTDSIAINGVCLTVTNVVPVTSGWSLFTADVMKETFSRSNLGQLKVRHKVNLERALKVGDRMGGHIVTGHINGIGTIKSIKSQKNSDIFEIAAPPDLLRYLVSKGSVALDGISLTVIELIYTKPRSREFPATFTVGVIPQTAKTTTFGFKSTGDTVNVEVDIISKYVEKMLQSKADGIISEKFLKEKGFSLF
jgi:riboflavin synthase